MVTLTSMAGVEGDARLHLPPLFFWISRDEDPKDTSFSSIFFFETKNPGIRHTAS
jgi:hypothetical protein